MLVVNVIVHVYPPSISASLLATDTASTELKLIIRDSMVEGEELEMSIGVVDSAPSASVNVPLM
jgi:hypothetical protein